MLRGAGVFLVCAFAVYFLSVWPFLLFPRTYLLSVLWKCIGLGLAPAWICGAVFSRKGELAGACGFAGGSLATAVFLFLRLQQVFTTSGSSQGPEPNYTSAAVLGLPSAWVALTIVTAALLVPRVRVTRDAHTFKDDS